MRIIQLIGTPGPKKHLRLQKNKLKELVDLAGINQQNTGRAEQTDRATNTLRAIKSLAICIRDCSQYTGS